MECKTFVFNPLQENTYVLFDQTREAVVVDAGNATEQEDEQLRVFIKDNNLTIKYLLCTHCHFDHIFGAQMIHGTYAAPIAFHDGDELWIDRYVSMCEMFGFTNRGEGLRADIVLRHGDEIKFGATTLRVIHVPGHSQASVAFYCEAENLLFCGDILFKGSVGRADLPGGNAEQLVSEIKSKLLPLPDQTLVFSGHGPSTTIGYERTNNPYL